MFEREFGWTLAHNVKLVLGDGYQYIAYFCDGSKLLIGLKQMLIKYSVEDNYVLSFDLVGRSTFYVNIYNEEGMDIFNYMFQKLTISTLINHLAEDVIDLTDSTMDSDNGL